jgi:hypothetical protein
MYLWLICKIDQVIEMTPGALGVNISGFSSNLTLTNLAP